MIQMINCNSRDMSSYYSGCTVIYVGGEHPYPVNISEITSRTTLMVYDGEDTVQVDRAQLRVHYFEPFYTDSGEYVGFSVDRSYKRAPVYSTSHFKYLEQMLFTGTLPSTLRKNGVYGRVGHQFYVQNERYGTVLYRDEPVGVFVDGVFYIPDACIVERLKEILAKEGIQYDVVQTSNRA